MYTDYGPEIYFLTTPHPTPVGVPSGIHSTELRTGSGVRIDGHAGYTATLHQTQQLGPTTQTEGDQS